MKMSFRFRYCLFVGITLALLAVLPSLPTACAQAQDPQGPSDVPSGDQTSLSVASASSGRCSVGFAVGGSADGYGVILRTNDGGITWTRQGGPGEIPDFSPIGVSAVDTQNAWVVGGKVILRTRNGGLTWKREKLPDGLPQDFELFQVKALDRDTAFAVGSQSVLLQTRSGPRPKGSSPWVRMPTAPGMPLILFSDVDAVDATHVWAVGGVVSGNNSRGGLAIAFYNGVRWKPQLITHSGSNGTCSAMIGVSAVDKRTAWAVGGFDCPPYRTVNGGKTWQATGTVLGPGMYDTNRVVGVTRNLIWVTADNGIFRTTDGGRTWAMTGGCSGGSDCYAITAAGSRHAWASDLSSEPSGDLYRWVGGGPWESQPVPATSSITMMSFVGARR
ncbi:MAG: YCF48-related protein [Syntrophobacteraceae bacterium]